MKYIALFLFALIGSSLAVKSTLKQATQSTNSDVLVLNVTQKFVHVEDIFVAATNSTSSLTYPVGDDSTPSNTLACDPLNFDATLLSGIKSQLFKVTFDMELTEAKGNSVAVFVGLFNGSFTNVIDICDRVLVNSFNINRPVIKFQCVTTQPISSSLLIGLCQRTQTTNWPAQIVNTKIEAFY